MFSDAELLAYIGPNGAIGTAEATILAAIEDRTIDLVQRATGRFFGASGAYTFYPVGSGTASIWIPDEITAVDSVSIRDAIGEDWTALVVSEDYERDGSKFMRTDGLVWPDGDHLVKIVATRGYASGEEPGTIRQLVLDLVAWQFRAGRNLSLEELGSPDVGRVKGWDRVIGMHRGPLYG